MTDSSSYLGAAHTASIPATRDAEAGGLRKVEESVLDPGQSEAPTASPHTPTPPLQPEMTTGQAGELKQEGVWGLGFLQHGKAATL